jgi:hypothetical protein
MPGVHRRPPNPPRVSARRILAATAAGAAAMLAGFLVVPQLQAAAVDLTRLGTVHTPAVPVGPAGYAVTGHVTRRGPRG